MKIVEQFIADILREEYPENYQAIYDNSFLLQYLDSKTKAVHGGNKTRRSLANIYAIYAILHFYKDDFYRQPKAYRMFGGYDYMRLFAYYRSLYGGEKLQNHALNSRVNGEFHNKFANATKDLIIVNDGKYLIHIDYIYVGEIDISKTVCRIIEAYIELLKAKDHALIHILNSIQNLPECSSKKQEIKALLTEDAEARIFEIISFAILKNHYKNVKVLFGFSRDGVRQYELQLYKTGRTNANDGGIDFVMRPIGRFFQVTEVNNYDKYLLDIDKVLHFPVTFVVKTNATHESVMSDLEQYIDERSGGMAVLVERYRKAIEEIITIHELKDWIDGLPDDEVDGIVRDIDIYYRLEMNIDDGNER